MIQGEPQQVILSVSLYKFLIALLLGGNTGLLGLVIRFIFKNYRKYKNAIMVFIEEHERLVEDYIRRHPEERTGEDYFADFTRGNKTKRPRDFQRTAKIVKSDPRINRETSENSALEDE